MNPQNVDAILGLGAHTPVLTDSQAADLDRLIADFLGAAKPGAVRLDAIQARLQSWSNVGGALNMRRAGDVLWSWTANPRVQQNGSALGRVYAKRRGQIEVDVGGFKVDRDGNVLSIPDAFRAALEEAV